MRMHQVGAAVVTAVAVSVLSASGPLAPRVLRQVQPPESQTSVQLVAVPARFSFDDLTPTGTAAQIRVATAPLVAVSTETLSRTPRQGAAGSSPAAGTPQAVLAGAYRKAVARAARSCHLEVAHLAAIGQVESGSIGGRAVTADHRVTPAIYGPLLDGGPFAVIRDSDDGAFDGASDFDRAMGPLQFLPGTWSWAGRDGDGDGRRDPQNVYDAALATADYLCSGGRDLGRHGDLRAAVLSYNQSGAYLSTVLEWVSYFQRHGLAALTSVAFRVGSGGRASAMTVPTPEPSPPANAPSRPQPTTTGSDSAGAPAGSAIPTTPPATGTPTAPGPDPSEDTTPLPSTPTPAPSTTPPQQDEPQPADPTPTPTAIGDSPP